MLEAIIQDFTQQMEDQREEMENILLETLDFSKLEQFVTDKVNDFSATILQTLLTTLFSQVWFLAELKTYGGKRGMRFKEYRSLRIQLGNGCFIHVMSPYFIKAPSKRKRKRKQKKGDAHLALTVCGFVSHVSPHLLSKVLQMAILCPSYEVAHTVLKEQGILMNVKTIRRLCRLCLPDDLHLRSQLPFQGTENDHLSGRTLVVSVDGGRIRQRKKKRGRRPKRLKQQGYHSDWKEPKLFTIYLLDSQGQVDKSFPPFHDATMGNHIDMFELLDNYLKRLDISQFDRIVFTADGGSWIWNDVEALIERMDLNRENVYQVLDHIHAKQNLEEIIDFAPKNKQKAARKAWQGFLFNGNIEAIKEAMKKIIKGKETFKEALNKWQNYFEKNKERMQYSAFKNKNIPCGSGHVESAIRRVINLRLKAPGTFWLKEMAECFLYLRSQLLSGRWTIFMKNLTALKRLDFMPFHLGSIEVSTMLKAA